MGISVEETRRISAYRLESDGRTNELARARSGKSCAPKAIPAARACGLRHESVALFYYEQSRQRHTRDSSDMSRLRTPKKP